MQSNENYTQKAKCQDSKLDMEQNNVAYESLNTAQISLGANVAYYESRKLLNMNMENINVAYGSSTAAQISLTSNAAYSKSGR